MGSSYQESGVLEHVRDLYCAPLAFGKLKPPLTRWEIYARLTQEAACDISRVVGSSSFVDVERGSFISEELEMIAGKLNGFRFDLEIDDEAEVSDNDGGELYVGFGTRCSGHVGPVPETGGSPWCVAAVV